MGLLLNWALLATAVLAGILYTQAEEQTSWSGSWSVAAQDSMLTKRSADADAEPKQGEEDVQGRNYAVHEPIYSNDTDINQIIDQIINSRREGRILNEYDRVYEDGNVDQALMQGNDMQARNLVRDKLCALGLMSCEEAKRPYYSSIYAQGPPKYGGGPYGAPKPMPPPSYFNGRPHMGPPPSSVNSFGPPRKVGYESSYKPGYRPSGPGPNYNGPYLESPPPSAIDGSSSSASFSRPPPGAVIYGSKPPGPIYTGHGPSPPYAFENPEKIQVAGSQQTNFYSHQSSASAASSSTKVVVAGGIPTGAAVASNSASSASSLQQHVHHHYHHVEGAEGAKVPSVAIPVGSGQTINTDFSALAQSSTAYTPETQGSFQTNSAFNAGFNGASQGGLLSQGASSFGQGSSSFGQGGSSFGQVGSSFGQGLNGFKPNGDLYSKPSAGLASFGGISSSSSSSGFGQSGFGQSGYGQASTPGSSYHSQNPDYYKKELHNIGGITASASNNFNSLTSGYGNEQFNGAYDTARNQFVDCQCVPFNQCPAADRIGRKEDLILPIDPRNLGKDIEALSDDAAANITVSATAEKKSDEHKSEDDKTEDKKRSKRQAIQEEENKPEDAASDLTQDSQGRAYYGNRPVQKTCRVNEVCCRRPLRPAQPPQQQLGRCGVRNAAGITGRIKNPVYVDGDSEFGEYPWHVAILKKDPKESIYACGGTLIDAQHVITAAHCIKSQNGFDLRARLGEWDVNHDVEFFPYIERDVVSVQIHPEYYAGTLDNDLAVLKLDHPVDFTKNPHISPACLPDKFSDFTGARCWTTGWGKDAFGDQGKYQNILKEVDVPILSHHQCENQLRQTRLGYSFKLNPGFVCAGGEEGKDACKGDGGGPLVCERGGVWNVVGVVSWGIGCGQVNVPGVYVKVSHYLDWIRQITQYYK
ncbi:uncharacterized protein LOC111683517 isoform X1 [Lucilia cuprina]|uniref:uncharacterized protein LOC111683517 isoform X1 n=1 Tax=Lucilia cuprina TaxID=7375 RepID=UPI001F067336|nr:uncharacterized protein LOC111683517 isoform X1 [Lucilia cuprina]